MTDVVFRGENVVFPQQSEANDGFVADENAWPKMENQNFSGWRNGEKEEKLEGAVGGKWWRAKGDFCS